MTAPLRYRAVFFDADDTLFDYPAAERAALRAALDGLATPMDAASLLDAYRRHNAALWRAFERGETTQRAIRAERFRRLFAEAGIDGADPAERGERYLAQLSRQAQLIDGAAPLLRRLARRLPLALITNGIAAVQHGRLDRSGLRPCFAAIVISEEAGCAKPDPRIFEPALARLGVAAREVLYVGDSVTSDMPAAANAGMDFCWYNPAGLPLPEGGRARYSIAGLEELDALLGD